MPDNLKKLFSEICQGYSRRFLDSQPIYIKHLTHFDQIDIDDQYDICFGQAKERGLFTLDEKLKYLEGEGLWTKKNQQEVDENKNYLDNLKTTKSLLAFKRQIEQINIQIKEAELKYYTSINKKNDLIGMTCENYANKKIEVYYIKLLFFKNSNISDKLIDDKDIDDTTNEHIDQLLSLYSTFINDFSYDNIKKLSVNSIFTSLLYLSDDLYSFFGKPLCDLTHYQSNLLSYGQYYKNLMKNNGIPNDISEDPDKIEEYVKKTANMKELIEKSGGKRMGVVGASAEEIKEMGGGNIDVTKIENIY